MNIILEQDGWKVVLYSSTGQYALHCQCDQPIFLNRSNTVYRWYCNCKTVLPDEILVTYKMLKS